MPTIATAPVPPLIHVRVATADLCAALGDAGQPATLTFTTTGLTVTTPTGSRRIAAQVIARHTSGTPTAGIRPADADRLRAACRPASGAAGPAGTTADLRVGVRTVTLSADGDPVTVGRW